MPPRSPGWTERPAPVAVALAAIVAAAAALRCWGLDYGLPHPTARPDEEMLVRRLLGFDGGDWNPRWFMYPTFYLYVLYFWVKGLALGAHALGAWPAAPPLAELAGDDPTRLYLLARALSAAAGTLNVAIVFLLVRAVWNARAGLLAAALLAVSFLHVRDSHFFKPDAALARATTATLLACVRLEARPAAARAAAAGLACGLAFGVKYTPALVVPLAAAALGGGAPGRWRRLALALGAAGAAVVLGSPYMVLDYPTFAGWMKLARFLVEHGGEGIGTGFRFHAEHSFLLTHGLPFSLLALAAVPATADLRRLWSVHAFVLVSALQLGLASLAYTRYATPLLPALCVLAGVALERLTGRVGSPRLRAAATAALLAAVVARPLHASVRFGQILAAEDTRLAARAWLDRHVPAGSPVAVFGSTWPFTFGAPVMRGFRVRWQPATDPVAGWVVTHEHPLPFSAPPERFEALRPRLRLEAAFSPFADGDGAPAGAVFERRDAFYVPLAGFAGVERGGPVIRIYSVPAPGAVTP